MKTQAKNIKMGQKKKQKHTKTMKNKLQNLLKNHKTKNAKHI